MALNDRETAVQSGEPVNLYKVTYGDTATVLYTNAETEITIGSDVYAPETIKHTAVKNTGKVDPENVTVTVPLNSTLAKLFSLYPPSTVCIIEIRQGHVARSGEVYDDTTFPVAFTGRILESRREANNAQLTCDTPSLRRPGLTRTWQWGCPLVLYGSRCGATKTAFPATVLSVGGGSIELTTGWNTSGFPASKFITGLVEWPGALTTEQRWIRGVLVDGTTLNETLQLFAPIWDLVSGDTVSVYLGCRRTLDECGTIHANSVNFGGQPFIPVDGNPVGKNNHF